jgi:adenylosuccinate lyase
LQELEIKCNHFESDTKELAALLDPATYVGLAPAIVDRVLAATRASGWIKSLS